jgi:hypothetical protein
MADSVSAPERSSAGRSEAHAWLSSSRSRAAGEVFRDRNSGPCGARAGRVNGPLPPVSRRGCARAPSPRSPRGAERERSRGGRLPRGSRSGVSRSPAESGDSPPGAAGRAYLGFADEGRLGHGLADAGRAGQDFPGPDLDRAGRSEPDLGGPDCGGPDLGAPGPGGLDLGGPDRGDPDLGAPVRDGPDL